MSLKVEKLQETQQYGTLGGSNMLICVLCPKGCEINVVEEAGALMIQGNACPKGEGFAREEWYAPKRMLTTTVKTTSDRQPRLPVRSSVPVPKPRIDEIMLIINHITVPLPVALGDIIIENVLELGIDIIATTSMREV